MFKFRSGTHGLNKELGRHRGREGSKEFLLCDNECEIISHIVWDCLVCSTLKMTLMCKLKGASWDRFEHFESLDSFEKASLTLGAHAQRGLL